MERVVRMVSNRAGSVGVVSDTVFLLVVAVYLSGVPRERACPGPDPGSACSGG
jgi:hypothetical protein